MSAAPIVSAPAGVLTSQRATSLVDPTTKTQVHNPYRPLAEVVHLDALDVANRSIYKVNPTTVFYPWVSAAQINLTATASSGGRAVVPSTPLVPQEHSFDWDRVMECNPWLLATRDEFNMNIKPCYSEEGVEFVEINVGQILTGFGVQVCGFIALYFGIEAFSVLEQGKGTTRMMVLRHTAGPFMAAAKREGMQSNGSYVDLQSIEVHIRCADEGVYICQGPSALADIDAVPRSRNCPRHTCDLTEAHNGEFRVNHHRVAKMRNMQQQQGYSSHQQRDSQPHHSTTRSSTQSASYQETMAQLNALHPNLAPQGRFTGAVYGAPRIPSYQPTQAPAEPVCTQHSSRPSSSVVPRRPGGGMNIVMPPSPIF